MCSGRLQTAGRATTNHGDWSKFRETTTYHGIGGGVCVAFVGDGH